MFKFLNNLTLERIYFFIVFLFAARATVLTSNLDFRLNPVGFAMLVLPALHLLNKYNISIIKGRIGLVFCIFTLWVTIRYFVDPVFNMFNYYKYYIQLLVCYVVIKVYKDKIPEYFESITVNLGVISLIMWGIMQFVGVQRIAALGLFEPANSISSASFLIFNTPPIVRGNEIGIFGLTRNNGFAWEPGLFSCFLILAIYFNLCRLKTIRGNRNLYILLLTLLSTSSTTGYTALLVVLANYFFFQSSKVSYKISALIVLVPIVIWISQLSFIGEKIERNRSVESFLSENNNTINYFENNESTMVVQRFEGLYLDFLNFIHDPIVGYGYTANSFSATTISNRLLTSNGITCLFAQFGFIIAFLICMVFYRSARLWDMKYNQKYHMLLVVYIILSISYNFNHVALFMSVMWYSYFSDITKYSHKKCNNKVYAV